MGIIIKSITITGRTTFHQAQSAPGAGVGSPTFRYWGIQTSENNGHSQGAIGQLEMYESYGGLNVASRKVTETNVAHSTPFLGGAFSGCPGLDNSSFAHTVGFQVNTKVYRVWADFDTVPRAIKGVKLIANEAAHATKMPSSFDVIYSNDAVNWTVAYSVTNQTNWTNLEMRDFWNPTYTIPNYSGNPYAGFEFVSIYPITGAGTKYGIREMIFREVPGSSTPMELPQFNNGVTGNCAFGTQSVRIPYPGHPGFEYSNMNNCYDGDPSTFYEGLDKSRGQHIGYQYSLNGGIVLNPHKISEISITSYMNQAPTQFIVRGYENSNKSTSLFSVTVPSWTDGQTRVFTMPQYR